MHAAYLDSGFDVRAAIASYKFLSWRLPHAGPDALARANQVGVSCPQAVVNVAVKLQPETISKCLQRISLVGTTFVSSSSAVSSSANRAPRSDSTLQHHGQEHSLACSLGFSPMGMCRDTKSKNSARETGTNRKKHRTLTDLRRTVRAAHGSC